MLDPCSFDQSLDCLLPRSLHQEHTLSTVHRVPCFNRCPPTTTANGQKQRQLAAAPNFNREWHMLWIVSNYFFSKWAFTPEPSLALLKALTRLMILVWWYSFITSCLFTSQSDSFISRLWRLPFHIAQQGSFALALIKLLLPLTQNKIPNWCTDGGTLKTPTNNSAN